MEYIVQYYLHPGPFLVSLDKLLFLRVSLPEYALEIMTCFPVPRGGETESSWSDKCLQDHFHVLYLRIDP